MKSKYLRKRFFLEQLIYNRGFDSVNSFTRDLQQWALLHTNVTFQDFTIRQYISGLPMSTARVRAVAQFLDAENQISLIDAIWDPPEVTGCGEYWTEVTHPSLKPRLIRDVNIYAVVRTT